MAEIIFNTLKHSKHIKLRKDLMPSRAMTIYTGHPGHSRESVGLGPKKHLDQLK